MNLLPQNLNAHELWRIRGDFGKLTGEVTQNGDTYTAEGGPVRVTAQITKDETGVFRRKDKVENSSDTPITLYTLSSRFVMLGGEYGVYTQYNGWCDESDGAWQKLVTSVCARSRPSGVLRFICCPILPGRFGHPGSMSVAKRRM